MAYILEGIRNGFRIGFNYSSCTCKSSANNMASAEANPEPVDNYLMIELQTNRIMQVPQEYREKVQISRFGVIPKANQPGKWRLILDLSSPDGSSVNDGVDRSAPKIFSSVADALEWILLQHGVSLSLHYLDDFFTAGAANSSQCRDNLDLIIAICEWLGIPLKREKINGSTTVLNLLGIELDTFCSELRLPAEKICQLLDILESWKVKRRGSYSH